MKFFKLFIVLLFGTFQLFSQDYSRVRVFADQEKIQELMEKGVPLDHGMRKPGVFIETDLSSDEIGILQNEGINYEILISDVQAFYVERNLNTDLRSSRSTCEGALWEQYDTPSNFTTGSMAGFYTYQEFLDQLDSMASKFPNLITAKQAISTFQTHEGRPIYHVRISNNPGVDEGEPQVLYSAIHHAREPASLTQTIFYMWYLLENYGTNDEVTFLVDHTDMFFIPLLNPDGYVHNVVNNPNGGGMHRKNKRNVGTSNPGVDLNRNYDYQWGVSGVSGNVNNDTYPGTNGFSEPETQAMKWLCENNNFEFALNAHTYGDLLLYPFGYDNNAVAPDAPYFDAYTAEMVKQNKYINQKSSDLYPAAGDSDDWMYDGDLGSKPKIYALTPEIGYDFWPAAIDIVDICKKNVYQNLINAHLPHNYGTLTDKNPGAITTMTGHLKYETQRLGLNAGGYSVNLVPLQGFASNGNLNAYPSIALIDTEEDSISYSLDPNINFGDPVQWIWETQFGTWTRRDTITKTFGLPQEQFNDPGDDLNNWAALTSNWGTTSQEFYSPSSSITDSPSGNYSNNTTNEIELQQSFDLTNVSFPVAKFFAKWEIETGWDYVQFMASTDGGNTWIPLCGEYTKTGNNNQDEGQPLYDGFQTSWVEETVDLSDFIGQTVIFKFKLESDLYVNEDGFYFDDFKILFNEGAGSSTEKFVNKKLNIYPNPSNDKVFIDVPQDFKNGKIVVMDMTGRKVIEHNVMKNQGSVWIDLSLVSKGSYNVILTSDTQNFQGKLIVD